MDTFERLMAEGRDIEAILRVVRWPESSDLGVAIRRLRSRLREDCFELAWRFAEAWSAGDAERALGEASHLVRWRPEAFNLWAEHARTNGEQLTVRRIHGERVTLWRARPRRFADSEEALDASWAIYDRLVEDHPVFAEAEQDAGYAFEARILGPADEVHRERIAATLASDYDLEILDEHELPPISCMFTFEQTGLPGIEGVAWLLRVRRKPTEWAFVTYNRDADFELIGP